MPELRFGVLVAPDAPFATLAERWRSVEDLGFDFAFVADHYRHTRDPFLPWFDGWTMLAAMALETRTIRIGTLVANPVLREPAVMAKAAAAIDHLSNGRLELGIGMGVEAFDHEATGTAYWSAAERAARYREYVAIVDGVLRSSEAPFSFAGRYYRTTAAVAPAPVQQPRPPITVGGRSPTARRVAVERGDCWDTYALVGEEPVEEIVERTRRQNRELDEGCTQVGRDPGSLRRSLVLWKPLDPWAAPDAFERIVETFREAGIAEFVVMWPPEEQLPLLDRVADTLESLR